MVGSNFSVGKKSFLSGSLLRMLCNSLIQPHFDYACSAWYPNLNKKYINKVKIARNKCIRFSLFLESRAHIGVNEFRKINCLPTRERFEQCVNVGVYKFCKNISPSMSDIFVKNNIGHNTRRSTEMLNIPMKNTNVGQQGLSYLGPIFWNILPSKI